MQHLIIVYYLLWLLYGGAEFMVEISGKYGEQLT